MSVAFLTSSVGLPTGGEWLAVGLSYLLGSVPFSWLLARVIKGVDLRTFGSGNTGATNAGRVLGRPLGFLAFGLDFGKGWLAVHEIAPRFVELDRGRLLAVLCGAAAVLGHVWPIYLGFRGGKAVATGAGTAAAIDPMVFALGGGAWLITLYGTGYAGLSSMVMCAVYPLVAWSRIASGEAVYGYEVVWGYCALAVLVVWRHRANIQRMLAGTEPRRIRGSKHG